MATREETVLAIAGRLQTAHPLRWRRMFGEYAIYCNEKVVALVCDDQLFVKATEAGRGHIGRPAMAPPYPGAREAFLITGAQLEDGPWLSQLIALTEDELPLPKPKKPRGARTIRRG
jgi:DNA transformation protein and related proteins